MAESADGITGERKANSRLLSRKRACKITRWRGEETDRVLPNPFGQVSSVAASSNAPALHHHKSRNKHQSKHAAFFPFLPTLESAQAPRGPARWDAAVRVHHQHDVLAMLDLGKQHLVSDEGCVVRTGAFHRLDVDEGRVRNGANWIARVAESIVEVPVGRYVEVGIGAWVVVAAGDEDDGRFRGCHLLDVTTYWWKEKVGSRCSSVEGIKGSVLSGLPRRACIR